MRVGPFTWAVHWEAPEDGSYGDTDTYTLTIRVRPDLPGSLERETFMHELLHACYRTAGLDSTVAREEQIVSGVSPFLAECLTRDARLRAYLFGG